MKCVSLAILLLCAAVAAAQDANLPAGMKAAKASVDALAKMEKKTGPQATGAAERLASIYEMMIPFWRQRNAADAVKWSEEGKAAATRLASAAFAGDEAKAADAFKAVGDTCKPCHDARRERTPDGKYKIKLVQ